MLNQLFAAVIDTSNLPNPTGTEGTAKIDQILNIVFAFTASMAVLLIVIGGVRYILARGDPKATAGAKNTVLYALIGLVVVMAAYSIVTFVVRNIT